VVRGFTDVDALLGESEKLVGSSLLRGALDRDVEEGAIKEKTGTCLVRKEGGSKPFLRLSEKGKLGSRPESTHNRNEKRKAYLRDGPLPQKRTLSVKKVDSKKKLLDACKKVQRSLPMGGGLSSSGPSPGRKQEVYEEKTQKKSTRRAEGGT